MEVYAMANVSAFMGSINLSGHWEQEDINILSDVFKVLSRQMYALWIPDFNQNKLLTDSVNIYGHGKWEIKDNIINLFKWAKLNTTQKLPEENMFADNKVDYNNSIIYLMKRMEEHELGINISGIDLEEGNDFIISFTSFITINNSKQITDFDVLDYGRCTLKEYDRIADGDTEYMDRIVGTVLHNYNLPNSYSSHIEAAIKKDPDWYSIRIDADMWGDSMDDFIKYGAYGSSVLENELEQIYLESLRDDSK